MEIFFFQMDNGSAGENAFFGKLNAGVSEGEVTAPAAFSRLGCKEVLY